MAANGSGSVDEAAASSSQAAPSSPNNKVKFLCSHGGKILPRPADSHLKYAGGETRVVSVPRTISFSELTKKLSALFEGDMVLKYQLAAEDLDALVSVKSDEDLKHMFEEHDRQSSEGTPKLRAFLFPAIPTVIETPQAASLDPHALEQRYIDAVNGVIRMNLGPTPGPGMVLPPKAPFGPYSPGRATLSVSSACSSPKSPSPDSNPEYTLQALHKVHSSPSLYGLGTVHHGGYGHGSSPAGGHHYYGLSHHHHHGHGHQVQHQIGCPPPRPVEPYRGSMPDRLASVVGRGDIGKSPLNQGIGPYYRSHRASGHSNNFGYSNDYGVYGYRRPDRADSLPQSPRMTIWEGQSYKGEHSQG